jgi:hypothetical protein
MSTNYIPKTTVNIRFYSNTFNVPTSNEDETISDIEFYLNSPTLELIMLVNELSRDDSKTELNKQIETLKLILKPKNDTDFSSINWKFADYSDIKRVISDFFTLIT